MKVTIKFLSKDSSVKEPYATIKGSPYPGGLSFNGEREIVQVNQSTCNMLDNIVLGKIHDGVKVEDGEQVEILFMCKKKSKCGYPFCSTLATCEGNDDFYIPDREDRGY